MIFIFFSGFLPRLHIASSKFQRPSSKWHQYCPQQKNVWRNGNAHFDLAGMSTLAEALMTHCSTWSRGKHFECLYWALSDMEKNEKIDEELRAENNRMRDVARRLKAERDEARKERDGKLVVLDYCMQLGWSWFFDRKWTIWRMKLDIINCLDRRLAELLGIGSNHNLSISDRYASQFVKFWWPDFVWSTANLLFQAIGCAKTA